MNLTAANTAIVLDSTADFPEAPDRFQNWRVVPLYVLFGDASYRDYVELTPEEFYARLRTAAELPTTSQPTPGDFLTTYEELNGYERIYSIHLSSALSGTYQSATTAAAELGDKVRVIDSETASAAIAMLGLAIQRRLDRGTTEDEIDTLIGRFKTEASLIFTVDTLEFLRRGGRIGRASAWAGNLLHVKPILTIKREVVPLKRVRGNQKAMQEFVSEFTSTTRDTPTLKVGIAHADAPERAEQLKKMVHAERPQAEVEIVTTLGAVVGTHAGPGTVGFFWFDDRGVTTVGVLLPVGFGGADVAEWPRLRTFPRAEELERPVDVLAGVGPAVKKRLERLGLKTLGDLVAHRPFRYEEPVPEVRMADLQADRDVAIAGEVLSTSTRRRGRLQMLTARISDGSATVSATWFNQPWLERQLQPGTAVRLRGRQGRYGFDVRGFDIGEGEATADFAPVYPASEDITAKKLRELVGAALPHALADPLPADLKQREELPERVDALWALHRPRSLAEAEAGRRRLAFDELLLLQIWLARRRRERESEVAPALGPPGELVGRYREVLPFRLTEHQERAIADLDADLERSVPMQRLLQGEVGSGKTVVALYALLRAVEAGKQGALMAPTETLAEQHFLTLEEPCSLLGVTCALLTSSTAKRERDLAPNADIVVGTHALIQEGVEFRDLAVAVVDEQHRFGVEQRKALTEGRSPHVLHMTATPIPRTLALTVYGDLAVSEISRPPADRKPIKTAWVAEDRSAAAYSRLRKHLDAGRQAYVVCPLIEESETSQARAAEAEADRLQQAELRGYQVGLLHGRLRPAERRELMARFKAGELDVLVATTVIEVGVDVPNATIMIVQEADRFGLAQLHQLRGRVGRGAEQSYCLLVSRAREDLTEHAVERLEALVRTNDGFELAEVDLDIRGSGHLLGTRQSGLTDLRFAHLRKDRPLLERARAVADELVDADGPISDEVERAFSDRDLSAA